MNKLIIGLCSLSVASIAMADATVNFRNNVLSGDVLVYAHDGVLRSPLVNTDTAAYKAQLYWDNAGTWEAVGNSANFRTVAADNALAGTWSGANRTVVGPDAAAEIALKVAAWDSTAFATFEDAVAAGTTGWGESASFTYRNAFSAPPATTDRKSVV